MDMEERLEALATGHLDAAADLAGETVNDQDDFDWEPDDWHDELIGTVTHSCGCTQEYFNGNPEDMPPASESCHACKPCPACGQRYKECTCPVSEADFRDPFESEAEARERMSPAEQEIDERWKTEQTRLTGNGSKPRGSSA